MNRKINLALVLVAVFALGAVAASAAQAEGFGEVTIEGGGSGTLTRADRH